MHRVFVYGTLKRGFENHALLEKSVFLGEAHTAQSYQMRGGEFPVLREGGENRLPVSGELYDVDAATLKLLDDLEEIESGMYDRIEAAIIMRHSNATSEAYIYVGRADYWDYRPGEFYVTVDAHGCLDWRPLSKTG